MRHILKITTAICAVASNAQAGGIDRAQPSYSVLFESGNYLQFGFTQQSPNLSGKHPAARAALLPGATIDTEDMASTESQVAVALKMDLNDRLSVGFFLGQPYGAQSEYTQGLYGAAPAAAGAPAPCPPPLAALNCFATSTTNLTADWDATGFEAVLRYKFNDRASVYGGLRSVTSRAEIAIPVQITAVSSGGALPGDYFAQSSTETDLGFVLGAAYEIPDIAARVAVTYRSEIEHEFDVEESASVTLNPIGGPGPFSAPLLDADTKLDVRMPQSVTIDFQTGVAEDTLMFGSARWTEWSVWEVRTESYEAATGGEVVSFDDDIWTYSLGLGRRLSDRLSLFATIGYEEKKGGDASRLSPKDGYRSVGIGGSYAFDDMTLRAGLQHAWLGDAEASDGTEFTDNTVTGFGFSLGFNF